MKGFWPIVIAWFLICNIPAIILIIIGVARWRQKPEGAKKLFIVAGIYLIVAAGICGSLLNIW